MLCFDKLIRSFLIVSAAMSLGYGLYGCTSAGIQTSTGGPVGDVFSTFSSGEARLICGTSCSGAWGASRKKQKSFYDNALWKDLALNVARVGFEGDQSYFYLGRAAEGLGYRDAARTYYKLALVSFKCDGWINNCDGLVFPRDISVRLNVLNEQAMKEAAEKSAKEETLRKAAAEQASREATLKSEKEASVKLKTPEEVDIKIAKTQYISASDHEKQNRTGENTKLIAALDAVRGKTFWYLPNLKAIKRVQFGGSAPSKYCRSEEYFIVSKETSFVVVDYGNASDLWSNCNYLKLTFPDGKVGYLPVNLMSPEEPVIDGLYPGKENAYDFKEYIFIRPPQEIFAAEKKAAAVAAAVRKARGGVSIGMTSAQALNSNWGKPTKINRTTRPNGIHEQWVYGDRNYLYFENGILTTIQN